MAVGVVAAETWDNISLAGAFLIGAVLATIAVLRVVRSVSTMFEGIEVRRQFRRRHEPLPEEDDEE